MSDLWTQESHQTCRMLSSIEWVSRREFLGCYESVLQIVREIDTSSNSPDLIPTFDLWLAKEHGSRGSQAGISPSSNDFGLFPERHRLETITEAVLLASSSGISSVVKGIWESCDLFRIIISRHWGSRWQTWSLWNTLNIARCLTSDCKFNSRASIFKIKFLEILKIFFHKN